MVLPYRGKGAAGSCRALYRGHLLIPAEPQIEVCAMKCADFNLRFSFGPSGADDDWFALGACDGVMLRDAAGQSGVTEPAPDLVAARDEK